MKTTPVVRVDYKRDDMPAWVREVIETGLAIEQEDARSAGTLGCESAIRPFVVGRRAWLFSDTVAGANASANLYSLLQTCVVNGIDGYRYLTALLTALPKAKTVDDYEALLPWRLTPKS